jgi:D-sedoheptulose 7-phosphate isomerase
MSINLVKNHFSEHLEVFKSIENDFFLKILEISEILSNALNTNRGIYWCGNGGSASDSQHLAAELVGRFKNNRIPLKSLSFNSDTSVLTCIANDFGYDEIFSRQVESHCEKGDVLIVISTSGNSPNIISALKKAKNRNVTTIGLLGKGGGEALSYCDYYLVVPSNTTARVQEMHITIGHILCDLIEHNLGIN